MAVTTYSFTNIRTEFQANTNSTNPQSLSNVVTTSSGGFAVVYANASSPAGNSFPVLDIYDSPGDVSPTQVLPFDLNSPVNLQGEPVITRLADGKLVVVWKEGASGHHNAVLASIVDPVTGTVSIKEASITNLSTNGDPEVTALAGGNFVVTVADSSGNGVTAYLCSPTGGVVTSTSVEAGATDPAVVGLTGGRFVVTYVDGGNVNARLYEASGAAVSGKGEIAVGSGNAAAPQVAALKNGGFAIIYDDDTFDGTPGIALKIFDANGVDQTSSGPIRVDTLAPFQETDPEITGLDNGFILVTHTLAFSGTDDDVLARVYDSAGNPIIVNNSPDFAIDELTGVNERQSSIATFVSGQFVTTWSDAQGDESSDRISARVQELVRTITGGDSAEVFTGDALRDVIHAGDSADVLTGLGGRDDLYGEAGDDRFDFHNGNEIVAGEIIDGGTQTDAIELLSSSAYNFTGAAIASVELLAFVVDNITATLLGTQIGAGPGKIATMISNGHGEALIVNAASDVNLSGVAFLGWDNTDTVTINGTSSGENLTGSNQNDTINGNAGSDILKGGSGADILNGGLGFDTAVYAGSRSAYTVTRNGATVTVNGPDGIDTLTGVERLQFDNGSMSLRTENDFNGDGKSDVLFSNQGAVFASNYEWQLNNRSLLSQGAVDLYDKSFTVQIVGDYDGDGKSDVLYQNPTTGGVWEWRLDGRTILSQGAVDVGDPSFHLLGTGDLNGDGKDDLLFRNDAGFVYEWQMNGRVNTPLAVGALDPKWHVQGTGDFNGDGRDDILLHYKNAGNAGDPANGAFVVWQMNGNAIANTLGIERPDASWQTLGVGDFNGDGIDDLAIRNVSNSADNGAVWVYLLAGTVTNHGDGSKTLDVLAQGAAGIADPATWKLQEIGDLDGDGKDDILYRNDSGFFYSWDMNGAHIASEGLLQGAAQWADPSFAVVKPHWDLV